MRAPRAPRLEERRTAEFAAELRERARAWLPTWGLADSEQDFGRALLLVGARFSAEVAERLDGAGEKMRRGFLDWLAVRGEAARPARVPVVFKLAAGAQPVLAQAPVRMQADAGGTSVVFETDTDLRLMPGSLEGVVGVDPAQDAFYLPGPGLSDLDAVEPLPRQWQLKSFAAAGATTLQLDPMTGLMPGMLVEVGGREYRIVQVDNGIVTIEPGLDGELETGAMLRKVDVFAPFDGAARSRQAHALYLGHTDLLNLEAAATLEILGAAGLGEDVRWEYWGKRGGDDAVGWQPLTRQPSRADAVVLSKPPGAVELREIEGLNSRWIRAFRKTVLTGEAFQTDRLAIRVNASACGQPVPCPPAQPTPSPAVEAMANTTPLVIDSLFFPLGKEPRQFDAFYLGSQEAFSKKGAEVQLCFEMADPAYEALAAVRPPALGMRYLAGVARDGQLHLLQFDAVRGLSVLPDRGALQPPSGMLDPRPPYRTPIWTTIDGFGVAAAAGPAIWMWLEVGAAPSTSSWTPLGTVGPVNDPNSSIHGLVHLAEGMAGGLYALRDGTLFVYDLNAAGASWQAVPLPVTLKTIAPILVEQPGSILEGGRRTVGLIGIDNQQALYAVTFPAAGPAVATKLLDDVSEAVIPAAIARPVNGPLQYEAVAVGNDPQHPKLIGFRSVPGNFTQDRRVEADFDASALLGRSIDVDLIGGSSTYVISLRLDAQASGVARWSPFDPGGSAFFFTIVPSQSGQVDGSPTLLSGFLVLPRASGQVLTTALAPAAPATRSTDRRSAVIASTAADELQTNDRVALPHDVGGVTEYQVETVTQAGVTYAGETLYEFDVDCVDEDFYVFRANAPKLIGTVDPSALATLTLAPGDGTTRLHDYLVIETDASTGVYRVESDPATQPVTLDRLLDVADPNNPPATVTYQTPEASGARLVPLLRLDPTTPAGAWDARLLERSYLVFPGAEPEWQRGTPFEVEPVTGRPILVALGKHWSTPPPVAGAGLQFIVDDAVGTWAAHLGDTPSNPELSWEYWNGKGWWKLGIVDDTLALKQTGAVRFEVPADIAATDWSGKTNFWIRARLVGGDYGRETVTVRTMTSNNVTEQTVERSTQGIRAPAVLRLWIAYRICESTEPTFVVTEDSGSTRDQSDANHTPGAIVEAFVPLNAALGALSGDFASPPTQSPCDCGCRSAPVATPGARSTTGRALFLGLTATLADGPVNLLLLVDQEREHGDFAPIAVEALVADRFVPIIASDTTRALGESGVISMTFPVEPTPRELFGRTLRWLRLTPERTVSGAEWRPSLRGAYLNAVWASAAETLTRELLGSSEGAPNLTLYLARPAVLRDSLELRVREPLSDEEREALRRGAPDRVLSAVIELPGDWVLWERVTDPADEPPDARVYALDEADGEIRFGDGQHGMIPPIGRDSIVAFSYRHTEPGAPGTDTVPANKIGARATLNLISPVESVEAVAAADQAAGGAPPDTADRVVRFGAARLRHRERAVTVQDLEDLALQSSPDIVQARCLARPGGMRLVIVMRGSRPVPSAAQARELRRRLVEVAPPALSLPGALRIEGAALRRLRVALELRVGSLDDTGAVGDAAKRCVRELLDPATGGPDKDGWPLGVAPTEDDIAFALLDSPRLVGIGRVNLREQRPDGSERPWPATLKPQELAVLAEDPVRIQFVTAASVEEGVA